MCSHQPWWVMSYDVVPAAYHAHTIPGCSLKLILMLHLSTERNFLSEDLQELFPFCIKIFTFFILDYSVSWSFAILSPYSTPPFPKALVLWSYLVEQPHVLSSHRLRSIACGWVLLKRGVKEQQMMLISLNTPDSPGHPERMLMVF